MAKSSDYLVSYRAACVSRFPSPLKAIKYLRKNCPPSVLNIDILRPGSCVEAACQSIVSISYHMICDVNAATSQVRSHWEPSIARWMVFFLQLVLASVHVPREEVDSTILPPIIDAIPKVLDNEDRAISATATTKEVAASYLKPLVAQVWVFLVDTERPFGPWSSLLIRLCTCPSDPPSSASRAFEASPQDHRSFTITSPYHVDSKLGKQLLVQFKLRIRRLTEAKNLEVDEFRSFLPVLILGDRCFQGTNPICMGEDNYSETLSSMARLLAIILRKWTWLRHQPIENTQVQLAYNIATSILVAFRESLQIDTPSRIQKLLESGILKSLYYIADVYYTLGRNEAKAGEDGFIEAIAYLLDRIATFLPHYRVLRALIRDIHKFRRTALENLSPGIKQSLALREAWSNLLEKAAAFYEMRWKMKERGLCEHEKVFSPLSLSR
ncbi:hypothetical protein PM082_018333 [Marasmius tenuissimus]|nr:hypothetical protein PM082_018333 [Marasmius tenuissimus]